MGIFPARLPFNKRPYLKICITIMKKIIFVLLLLTGFGGSRLYSNTLSDDHSSDKDKVYLSCTGSDGMGADGSRSRPYYSLNKAVGRLSVSDTDTLFILVAPGNYLMDRPFVIDRPNNRPVVIRSTTAEKPCFMGAVRIGGWERWRDGLYRAYVPQVKQYGFSFEQLYINDRRATLARTPNHGFLEVESSSETPFVKGGRFAEYASQRICFKSADWASLRRNPREDFSHLKFRFYHKWSITQKQTEYLHPDSAYIYIKGEGMAPWNPITRGSRYVMTDYMSALDEPGEWYLDRTEGYVYYLPQEGEDLSTAVCYAPALKRWVEFKGQPDAPVSNIRLEGLSFRYSSYLMPQAGERPAQAAVETDAAVSLDFAENICFYDCEMKHTGAYAIWMRRECHNNVVDHCLLSDMGGGGIKIGEPYYRTDGRRVSHGNMVHNSIITHAGIELPSAVGVAILLGADNRITHNEISDLRYSGVSVGWVWGYNDSDKTQYWGKNKYGKPIYKSVPMTNPAVRNVIEYNHIHHIGWGELSDMGAVYTLGETQGTQIKHNVIHDVWSYDYGGWGLYTDEGSSDVEMSSNLVYRCKSGGFHQHYGRNNRIENNIFAFGHYYQVQYTRPEAHLSFTFKHNILLCDKGEVLAGKTWLNGKVDMDYNLYWGMGDDPAFAGKSFTQWKKEKEPHAVKADPLFVDARRDDFRFRSKSSARKVGYKAWDYAAAGVYGSDEWKQKAVLPAGVIEDFNKAIALRMNK